MISRIYRILLGEEDMPTSERSIFYNNKSYTDKVYNKAIDDMIKDKTRWKKEAHSSWDRVINLPLN